YLHHFVAALLRTVLRQGDGGSAQRGRQDLRSGFRTSASRASLALAMSKRRPSQRAYMQKYNHERRDYRRQYRLSKQHWHYQTVRPDHDDAQMLKAIAKRRRTTVAELIRTYVTWGLEEDDSARRPDDL